MANKKTSTWRKLNSKNYRQKLHRAQGGMCAGCFRYLEVHKLKRVTKDGETNWFELRCKDCR